jgi:hypothetical protein
MVFHILSFEGARTRTRPKLSAREGEPIHDVSEAFLGARLRPGFKGTSFAISERK